MKKGLLLLVAIVLMGFGSIEMNRHVPPEVVETATDNYQEFLSYEISDGNPENWTLGEFVADNQLVIDNKLNLAIRPLNEWVAPVLYNGAIVNAIRVYEPLEGRYEIAEYGYSKSFSESLEKLGPDEYFLSNMQFDLNLGYTPSKDNIRPFGDTVRLFEEWGVDPKGISISEFEVLIKQHLKEAYPGHFSEKTPESRYYLLALIQITLIAIAFIFLVVVLRKNKRSEKAG